MTLRTFTVFLWACLIATAAIAAEEHRAQITIAADSDIGWTSTETCASSGKS